MECGHPVDVPKSFLEVVNGAQKLEDTVQPVLGLGFDPPAMKDADHDAVSMLPSLEARLHM